MLSAEKKSLLRVSAILLSLMSNGFPNQVERNELMLTCAVQLQAVLDTVKNAVYTGTELNFKHITMYKVHLSL